MFYTFLKRQGGQTFSGWAETWNGYVTDTSPALKRLRGQDIGSVVRAMLARKTRVVVYESRDASTRKQRGRAAGRSLG